MSDDRGTINRRQLAWKRGVEVSLVALPGVLLLVGMFSGSLLFEPLSIVPVLALLGLAAWVWTQHVSAYIALLILGAAGLFSQGMVALALWVFGGIFILVGLSNIAIVLLRKRQLITANQE